MKTHEKTSNTQCQNESGIKKVETGMIRQLNDSEAKLVGGAISVRVPPTRGAGQG